MDNIYLAIDADNAGRLVGQAGLADDEAALSDISARIDHGQEVVKMWAENHSGSVISSGGDEANLKVPAQAIDDIETLRKDYEYATKLTLTVGVGASLSQAGKSLMVGKTRGKNQTVQYEPSIDQEFAKISSGSDEESKKIAEAYIPSSNDGHDHTENCEYCKEAETLSNEHDHTEDCEYCREAENEGVLNGVFHEHEGDDCQYCKDVAEQALDSDSDEENINPETDDIKTETQSEQSESQGEVGIPVDSDANPSNPEEVAEEIATQIETDDPNTQTERGVMDNIDSSEQGLGDSMEDNVSVQDDPSESDRSDNTVPELGSFLKESLDQNSDNIRRERVVNLVSQALSSFKSQKQIVENAKDQAPELYQSMIGMIRAMVEMAKMLGLGDSGGEDSEGPIEAQVDEIVNEDGQAQPSNEWNDPFPQHPEQAQANTNFVGQAIGKLSAKHTTKHVARTPYPPGAINGKGQQKIIDPVTGKTRWVNRKQGMVQSATGVPIKPPGRGNVT